MGVLKNDVGRPSNKTIMIRRILKGICLIIVIALAVLVGYYLKGNEDNKSISKDSISNNTINSVKSNEKFDISKITTKCIDNECSGIYVYAYGKEIKNNIPYVAIQSKDVINDVAIIELGVIDTTDMIIVNKEAEILYDTEFQEDIKDLYFISDKEYFEEFYGYKINNNTIKFTMGDIGQDVPYTVCNFEDSKVVYSEYEMEYKNQKISKPKKISSMTASEFILKHNIDCNKVQNFQ